MRIKRFLVSVFIVIAAFLGTLNIGGIFEKAESNNNIEIWAWGPYAVAAQEAANIYNVINPSAPSINVVDYDTRGSMMDDFHLASALGMGPDIMIMEDSQIPKYYNSGDILPCGIHYCSEPAALYYNQSIMAVAGIEINDMLDTDGNLSWDEYLEIGRIMQAAQDDDMYLFQYSIEMLEILFWSGYDGDPMSSFSKVATILKQFYDDGLIYDGTYQDTIGMLNSGQLASMIGGPWLVPVISQIADAGQDEWRVTNIPKSDIFSRDVYLRGYSWVISNYSNNVTEAVNFLKDMFQVNAQFTTTMAEDTLIVPVLNFDHRPLVYNNNLSTLLTGQNGEHPIEFLFDIFGRRQAAFCILGGDPSDIGFAPELPGGFDVVYIDLPLEFLDEWMDEFLNEDITLEELLDLLDEWIEENEFYDLFW